MTTLEFYNSLVGLTIGDATKLLINDPKGEADHIIDRERGTIKLAKIRGRINVATARNRQTDEWLITKVYGRY